MTRIPEITSEELRTAINTTQKKSDSNGIRAEDIKACDDETREMVRQIFNEINERPKNKLKITQDSEAHTRQQPPCDVQND